MDVFQTECAFDAAGGPGTGAKVDVECTVNLLDTSPQGLKPRFSFCGCSARLKSCPTKKQQFDFAPSRAGSMEKKQSPFGTNAAS
jgi:hypothetical protein